MKLRHYLYGTIVLCFLSISSGFANNNYPNAQTYSTGVSYRGVNLAGGAFNDSGNGWAPQGHFLPKMKDAALFLYKGMNIYRIPIAWEYIADMNGNLQFNDASKQYLTNLDSIIEGLTKKNATVVIDLHNYMRYNSGNVAGDYNNFDPNGPDVIGSGANAPTQTDYTNLWKNIALHFTGKNIIYEVMNEPHDMNMDLVVANEKAAIAGIRGAEANLKLPPHLILLDGNYWSGLHSWNSDSKGPSNASALANLIKSDDNLAIDVHQYFDENSSGNYSKDCVSPDAFKNGYTYQGAQWPGFNTYWQEMKTWAKSNHAKLFIGEFGSPDSDNCRADTAILLNAANEFAYNKDDNAGVIGWTVWSAGGAWGNYDKSIAPGGPANSLMYDFYPQFLTKTADLPPLPQYVIASIKNETGHDLLFDGGQWPFQKEGSATLKNGETALLYSDTLIPAPPGAELLYMKDGDPGTLSGAGVDYNGYGYSYGQNQPIPADSCNISGSNRCWVIRG